VDDLVVIVSDMHINSMLGLCKRSVNLDEGGTYRANAAQLFILDSWLLFWSTIKRKKKRKKLTVVINGDAIEFHQKHRTNQIITTNKAVAVNMAIDILEPVASMADYLFFLRGTEAHVGHSGEGEELLADDLGAVRCEATNTASWYQLRAKFGDVTFDIQHHGTMGNLPHTSPNAANKLAFMSAYEHGEWGERAPRVAVRSHMHRKADSGGNYPTLGIFTPCWQYPTAYISRIGAGGKMPCIGGVWFEIRKGELIDWDFETYKPTRSAAWRP